MRKLWCAALAAGLLAASAARAEIVQVDFNINFATADDAFTLGDGAPYGLDVQSLLAGFFIVDSQQPVGQTPIDFGFTTGTQDWTAADLMSFAVFFSPDAPMPSFNFSVGSQGTTVDSNNFTRIIDGNRELACNGCVRVGATFDLGPSPVPEPATWGLMILGFGGIGAMLRRRYGVAIASA